jgi:hypothetical protein
MPFTIGEEDSVDYWVVQDSYYDFEMGLHFDDSQDDW